MSDRWFDEDGEPIDDIVAHTLKEYKDQLVKEIEALGEVAYIELEDLDGVVKRWIKLSDVKRIVELR